MTDIAFSALLTFANLMVAWLNVIAWDETCERRDMVASVAWIGSTCYWAVRLAVAISGFE